MASNNRATQINKVLKVVKKHFKPFDIPADRPVLDNLIYACCLENSLHDAVSEVFETLSRDYYDWNEVRVTSIRELAEVMKRLNDPEEAATRLKRVLQSVFETHYSFDMEPMKKQNIGQTVKQLEKYNGTTSFTVAFVTQNALGGHAIPVNLGLLESMRVVGVISDAEAAKGSVPGLERAVPKTKGVEISTLLHQLGVELSRSPYGPTIRKLLLEIEPTCKDNLPKRPTKKAVAPPPEEKPAKQKPAKGKATKAAEPKTAEAEPASKKKTPTKKQAAKTPAAATPKKKVKKKVVKKKVVKKKSATKQKTTKTKTAKKNSTTKKKPATQAKKKPKPKAKTKRKPR